MTLEEIMAAMAPFAGGTVPSSDDEEYANWVRWIQQKQNEYAYRGQWRRLLKKVDLTITSGVAELPTNFFKPTGIYALFVDEVDLTEQAGEIRLFVYMELDTASANYGKWYVETNPEITETAIMYYFGAPGIPEDPTDKIILPGDMVMYGALQEYFREEGSDGSLDDARVEAENRFQEYLSLENLPTKQELASFSFSNQVDRTAGLKQFYTSRPGRYRT